MLVEFIRSILPVHFISPLFCQMGVSSVLFTFPGAICYTSSNICVKPQRLHELRRGHERTKIHSTSCCISWNWLVVVFGCRVSASQSCCMVRIQHDAYASVTKWQKTTLWFWCGKWWSQMSWSKKNPTRLLGQDHSLIPSLRWEIYVSQLLLFCCREKAFLLRLFSSAGCRPDSVDQHDSNNVWAAVWWQLALHDGSRCRSWRLELGFNEQMGID